MSDSEDVNNVPDVATAQKLVKEFENLTKTDEILAQMFLQENQWDLKKALNSYFAAKYEKLEAERAAETEPVLIDDKEAGNSIESAIQSGVLTTEPPSQLTIDTLSKSFFSIPHFNSGIDHFILLK